MTVTCAHCLADWPENGPVHYAYGDWWCDDPDACGERMARLMDSDVAEGEQ